jgi:hypothetical protein
LQYCALLKLQLVLYWARQTWGCSLVLGIRIWLQV